MPSNTTLAASGIVKSDFICSTYKEGTIVPKMAAIWHHITPHALSCLFFSHIAPFMCHASFLHRLTSSRTLTLHVRVVNGSGASHVTCSWGPGSPLLHSPSECLAVACFSPSVSAKAHGGVLVLWLFNGLRAMSGLRRHRPVHFLESRPCPERRPPPPQTPRRSVSLTLLPPSESNRPQTLLTRKCRHIST